jgi:hypothetical protein
MEPSNRHKECNPTGGLNSAHGDKESHFPLLLLFASSLLLHHFFFPSTIALHHERLELYTTVLNDERRVTLSFSLSCPSLSYHGQYLPFASLPLFFSVDSTEWQWISAPWRQE